MALVVGCVLLTVFSVPAMMVFFACMLEQKNFRDGVRESREILKGKWPRAGLTAGSIKPVSDPGAGPSLWGSYGDRRHTGNSFCKGLHSYRSYGNGQLPDRMDDLDF